MFAVSLICLSMMPFTLCIFVTMPHVYAWDLTLDSSHELSKGGSLCISAKYQNISTNVTKVQSFQCYCHPACIPLFWMASIRHSNDKPEILFAPVQRFHHQNTDQNEMKAHLHGFWLCRLSVGLLEQQLFLLCNEIQPYINANSRWISLAKKFKIRYTAKAKKLGYFHRHYNNIVCF